MRASSPIAGPDASSAVVAAGPIFTRAQIGFISGSATRVTLTTAHTRPSSASCPNDGVQEPTDANFMIRTLHAKKVVLVDNQTDYSIGLNDERRRVLKAAGVTVVHASSSPTQNDFSSLIATIGSDVDRSSSCRFRCRPTRSSSRSSSPSKGSIR